MARTNGNLSQREAGLSEMKGRRGEAMERRTKTHFGREDPIAWFGLAESGMNPRVRRFQRENQR